MLHSELDFVRFVKNGLFEFYLTKLFWFGRVWSPACLYEDHGQKKMDRDNCKVDAQQKNSILPISNMACKTSTEPFFAARWANEFPSCGFLSTFNNVIQIFHIYR